MGIQARMILIPLSAALFGAAGVSAIAHFALHIGLDTRGSGLLAAAAGIAAGLPALFLCIMWCRSRQALSGRGKRFDSVWDSRLIGLFSTGPDLVIHEANPTFLSMTGYAQADLRAGIRILDLTAADYLEFGQANRARLELEGSIGPFERDWVRKNGERFASRVYASKLEDDSFLVMIMDITDWKATQRELRERESRYRSLLSSRLLGIFVTDMQGRISEANDTFLGMIRRTRAEMEAGILTSQSMATPEWLFGAEARRDRFKDEGTMGPLEREWVLSDGSRLHSLFFVTRLEDSGKALCMVVDATDLKQARRQLHAVETRYKKLFDSNIVGIAVVDGNQVFVEANDTFLRMVGYDRMDLSAGRLTSYALRRPDAEREHRAAEARMQGTGRMLPQETVYVRKDGSMIPVFRGVTRLDEADRYLIIAIDLSVLRATQTTDTPQESSIPSQPS